MQHYVVVLVLVYNEVRRYAEIGENGEVDG